MKLNFWQIATTVIGITVAFLIVEEIKKRRARNGGNSFNVGVGAGVNVETTTDNGSNGNGNGGTRTVSY